MVLRKDRRKMKEIILSFSLHVDDDVDTDNQHELSKAVNDACEELLAATDWDWALAQRVVVPDDIGDDEYYKLVRTKK